MEIKTLQEQVDNWIKTIGVRYFEELTNMAILTEEVGEVARIIARRYGEQSEKESDRNKKKKKKKKTPGKRVCRCAFCNALPCQSNWNRPAGCL